MGISLVGQGGNGDGKPLPKICPLGWGLVVMDTSGIIPGGGQQPQQVAPNCVEARCAFWNDEAKACSVAVLASETQRRTDQLEERDAVDTDFRRGLLTALESFPIGGSYSVNPAPAPPPGLGGKDAETPGNAG